MFYWNPFTSENKCTREKDRDIHELIPNQHNDALVHLDELCCIRTVIFIHMRHISLSLCCGYQLASLLLWTFLEVWRRRIHLDRRLHSFLCRHVSKHQLKDQQSQLSLSIQTALSYLQRSSWVVAAWQWSCPACTRSVCGDGPFAGRSPESRGSYSQDTRCPWTPGAPET